MNGKFLAAGPTGVRRMAQAMVETLDGLIPSAPDEGADWWLATPSNAINTIRLSGIERRQVGQWTSQAWEQIELHQASRGRLLVNLCNMAPVLAKGTVTAIHDAHVFVTPESSSRAFSAWYRFALPRIAKSAAAIVTVSEYSRNQLVEHGVATADKITVVHNGADHLLPVGPVFSALDRLGLHDRPFVVAAGNVQHHKNIGLLFDAFARAEMRDLTLVLVGPDGRSTFRLAGLQPPDNVLFAGHIPDAELKALYQRAVCLAFPSTTEGFGLPPAEAMSVGCPVVSSPCGALPEVCAEAALYAPADDPVAWAEQIMKLALHEDDRQALIAAGRINARRFRWDNSAAQMLSIIEAAR